MAICCNMRPLLAALEIKYELPCRDDIWEGTTADDWQALVFAQDGSFNEEEDDDANAEPRPAHGDLYGCLARLMNPDPSARGRPLGLLWHSSFTCLVLIIQILMMTRDLTLAGSFLYHNIRPGESKNNLSIISEVNRAPIMQALDSLADLMRKPNHGFESSSTKSAGWDRVWTIWHYAALSLTQQEALLTSGIVEYSLPNAVSTCWELNKPRSKQHRDVYDDRDGKHAIFMTFNQVLLTPCAIYSHKDRKQHGEHFAPHVPVLEELYPWIRDYFKRVCDMPNS
ncbi:hypothetical protein ColTof3_08689 [Colletotrichum tofieldiae]|nr:hypothetical protein ColTof3_08689 [Colletotrichum tofieldiae]